MGVKPDNIKISSQIDYFYVEDYLKILSIRKITGNSLSSFGIFYLNFWETSTLCGYIHSTDCSSIIGQGTSEGGSTLIAYIN